MSHGFLSTSDRLAQEPLRDRNLHELLVSLCQLAEEQLAETKRIRALLANTAGSRSSVQIKSGTNGRPFDLEVKSYGPDSPVIEAESEAVQSFLRLRAELESRLMAGWEATAEAVRRAEKGKVP